MNPLHIAIAQKTKVTKTLESLYDVSYYKEQTFFEKLLMKEKKYPDIYFLQGSVNSEALDFVEHSKLSIVNSKKIKEQILDKRSYINKNKIEVMYPYLTNRIEYDKELKKTFKQEHAIDKETMLLLFSAKDIVKSGIDKFVDIILHLENKNYKLFFDITQKDQEILEKKLQKSKLFDDALIFTDYENQDELFIASDIFILPTLQQLFLPNVIKAMYLRNGVFVSRNNAASELIDSFSLILGQDDRGIYFKIDSLLSNPKELKKIQKENSLVVKNMKFERYMEELEDHIRFYFDF
jgi:hypothetical protein